MILLLLALATVYLAANNKVLADSGTAFWIQVGALVLGLVGAVAGFLIVWDEQKGYPWLRLTVLVTSTIAPTLLLMSAYMDRRASQAEYERLLDQITGGKSFPCVTLSTQPQATTNQLRWYVYNCGSNAIYDVKVTIQDRTHMFDVANIRQARFYDQTSIADAALRQYVIGTIRADGQERIMQDYLTYRPTGNVWRVMLTARNGAWQQDITLKTDGKAWTISNTGEAALQEYELTKRGPK